MNKILKSLIALTISIPTFANQIPLVTPNPVATQQVMTTDIAEAILKQHQLDLYSAIMNMKSNLTEEAVRQYVNAEQKVANQLSSDEIKAKHYLTQEVVNAAVDINDAIRVKAHATLVEVLHKQNVKDSQR